MAAYYNVLAPPLVIEASEPNLNVAAVFIAEILGRSNVPYAVMGGYNMKIRGSNRRTFDADFAVDASMATVWSIVLPHTRLIVPNVRTIEGVMRVFVKTGPAMGDVVCIKNENVCVDIILKGALGAPLSIETARDLLGFRPFGQPSAMYGLNLLHMMKSKLASFATRQTFNDFLDICHLLRTNEEGIRAIRSSLNRGEIAFFFGHILTRHKVGLTEQAQFRDILGV